MFLANCTLKTELLLAGASHTNFFGETFFMYRTLFIRLRVLRLPGLYILEHAVMVKIRPDLFPRNEQKSCTRHVGIIKFGTGWA